MYHSQLRGVRENVKTTHHTPGGQNEKPLQPLSLRDEIRKSEKSKTSMFPGFISHSVLVTPPLCRKHKM